MMIFHLKNCGKEHCHSQLTPKRTAHELYLLKLCRYIIFTEHNGREHQSGIDKIHLRDIKYLYRKGSN